MAARKNAPKAGDRGSSDMDAVMASARDGMPMMLTLPPDVRELAALQAAAESDAAALITLDASEDAATLDAFLTDVVQRKDAALAMRKRVTGPAYTIAREVEGWFRPLLVALVAAEDHLKRVLGAKRLAAMNAEREARELAAKAAAEGDADTMIAAVTIAADAAAPDGARATTRYVWAVARVIPDLLLPEYLTPDMAKIEAFAKAAPAGAEADEPVLPGVRFKRVPIVGARR